MDNKKIRVIGAMCVVALWAALAAFAWFGKDQAMSLSERRPLEQRPPITWENVLDGSFMEKFEKYSLDQFPLRDTFRQIKSLNHYYLLGQSDNNDIYIADGSAVKQEYPLNQTSVDRAVDRFRNVYQMLLKDKTTNIYMVTVPDKGYYLAEKTGHLSMDYSQLFATMEAGIPWAMHIDITDTLTADSYYRTDTHWRQELLLDTAAHICNAMGVTPPVGTDYTSTALERPFYGVYYGQAALPMEPDTMYLLNSRLLEDCETYLGEWDLRQNEGVFRKLYDGVYDMEKLGAEDLYEVYLSGPESLLRIENPNAATDRELIVFRDSFGSSIVPLLVQDYAVVTVVDIRYIQPMVLQYFPINWEADVLLLYSTLVLNNSSTLN